MPGAAATYADGNSVGRIVGEFDDEEGNTHGFIRSRGGKFTQFDVPGSVGWTSINGVNASGEMSGSTARRTDGTTPSSGATAR
jgi:hypothetical protein